MKTTFENPRLNTDGPIAALLGSLRSVRPGGLL